MSRDLRSLVMVIVAGVMVGLAATLPRAHSSGASPIFRAHKWKKSTGCVSRTLFRESPIGPSTVGTIEADSVDPNGSDILIP